MLEYNSLKRNERKLIALTGLTSAEFESLLPAFARVYRRRYPPHRTRTGQLRQRRNGGGRKARLDTIEQKLLFILVYQKAYPLQELLGTVFRLSQSRTNRWIHQLLPVLRGALAGLGVLPERNPRQSHASSPAGSGGAPSPWTSSSTAPSAAASGRKTRKNRRHTTAARRKPTATRTWSW